MPPFTYRDLDAWQASMNLVEDCYRATMTFPVSERYGLASQLRRAAVSIPANIAEGRCRKTTKGFAYHVAIALGSLGELETYLELAKRLRFLGSAESAQLNGAADAVGRQLNALHRSLRAKIIREEASTANS